MTYAPKLSLKQAPTLTLNAALLQAIQLLPMTRQELVELIRQELTDNPMLEEVAVAAEGGTPTEADDDASLSDAPDRVTEGAELDEMHWAAYVPDEWEWHGLPIGEDEERQAFEPTVGTATTLQEHLLLQLLTATGDAEERRVGAFLIGNLDEAGYLRCTVDDVMASTQADRAAVERVLATIQSFDPAGVGARDLRECLVIQVRALGLEGTLLDTIVTDHLPMIEARELAHISDIAKDVTKRLNFPSEEVEQALHRLRTFDPTPGLRFASEPSEAIIPDVIVQKVGQDYQVFLNDEGLPRLRLNSTYRRLLRDGQPEEKRYVADKLRAAVGLIRGIEQRRQTISKVATSIVKFQREFFALGLAHLKPLVLKDVAADIGMHESTVSRVTSHKYMDTERGLFELKYFFHSGLQSYGGETLSSLTVKARLKQLTAAEDPAHPLTDQQLVERLAAESIKIARRTVAKYRRELKLPKANRRKRRCER
jgi:RNA polymerase sigma-54 factor